MTTNDRQTLRDLASRIAEIAATPQQQARVGLWTDQNALRAPRPLVYCSPEGSWRELLPHSVLTCEDDDARGVEYGFLARIYAAEHFDDDQVCDNVFRVGMAGQTTGWGVGPQYQHPEEALGAYVWEPPIKTIADIEQIQTPTTTYDPEATQRNLDYYGELLGDLLEVRLWSGFWWALGLIDEWTFLRGITPTFWDMSDNPAFVHAGMRRLMEGRLEWLRQLEDLGVLSLNNENCYVGSGAFGYSDQLPQADFAGTVRLKDMWGFCEAQTMSEVSPGMHEEFVLQYQLPILERFGLNCYGCCEPLHNKLDMLLAQVPNLRRVSISTWADKRVSAEKLLNKAIFSWKPNPASLASITFDPHWVRTDIRETVDIAREHGCTLEIVIKDTHTCNNQPERFDEWTKIAMEEAQRGTE
jgi:hypothetical protein